MDRILRDIKLGYKVYCNFPVYEKPNGEKKLHPKIEFYQTWDDIRNADNGKIYLDEAPRWFSSRNFAATSANDLEFFAQHRHNGLGLILICQSPQQLDVEIRDRLAAYVWYIKRLFGPDPETDGPTRFEKIVGWNALVRKFVASDFRSAKRFSLRSYNMNLQQFHKWYDTDWIVGGREGQGTGLGKTQRGPALASVGADASQTVKLLDGSTLTKEEYFAALARADRGECWAWRPAAEPVEDTIFRGGQNGTKSGRRWGVAVTDGGGDRGGAGGPVDVRGGGAALGGPSKRVFRMG